MTDELATVETASELQAPALLGAPTLQVQLKMLDAGLEAPSYAHPGDAGADLRAREDVVLRPGERKLVPTGVSISLPDGFVALIHPRAGLAHDRQRPRHGGRRLPRRNLRDPPEYGRHTADRTAARR